MLRVGDTLSLSWAADNNTETISLHNLHADELTLIVRRAKGEPLHFVIARTVTPENSARMIQRYG
jgi:hypothetical protein